MVRMRFAAAVLCLCFGAALTAQVSTVVTTQQGSFEGEATRDGKVVAFKGIPYAAPPVGDLRWSPPQPPESWTGRRDARSFGYRCVQSSSYNDMVFHDPGASEDCLTLNVWTPANAKPGSLPVMVWIYGGGLSSGGTSENRQHGEFLAQRGVVVVSMNYRLGILGFFTHPELTAASAHHASGNYGLLDQVAALAWVKANIAAFGGDASRVTIFGESAGSYSVSAQMASPLARGLFQRAIGESGGAVASSFAPDPPLAQRERSDASFALSTYGTSKLADLRRLSTEDLMRPILAAHGAPRFSPVVDGYFYPRPVAEIYAAGEQAHVPTLAGWNADEGRAGLLGGDPHFSREAFQADAAKDFPGQAERFFQLYPAGDDAQALQSAADYAGDRFIAYSTWRWLEAQAATGKAPVYRYLFALGNPGDRYHTAAMGAFHSDDIEYVFGTLDLRPDALWRPEDRALSETVQSYWVNFARTGDPNGKGLLKWPVYEPQQWMTMHLDRTSGAQPDTHRDRYLFLDSVWSKQAQANPR